MEKTYRLISLLWVLVSGSLSVNNEDGYIDPFDMENFDPSTNSMKEKEENVPQEPVIKTKEKKLPDATVPKPDPKVKVDDSEGRGDNAPTCQHVSSPCQSLFRQYVKYLLYHIKGKVYSGAEELNLRVKIQEVDVEYLEKYTDSPGSEKDVRHVHEILSSMVLLATEVQDGDPSVKELWIESLFGMPLEKFVMLVVLAGLVGVILVAANKFDFSWRRVTVKAIFFLFVISVFWQWYELYKIEEAKQHMTIMKDMPEGCRKREKEENFLRTAFISLTSIFTFQNDECLKYYEHMLIDPFWKVTPTEALAQTAIRFFLSPARKIGEAIQQLLTGLLKDLPAQLWPVALGFLGVSSFLLLFMYFGYKFSLPFGLITIEPGQRADNSKVLEGLEEQKEQLKLLLGEQKRDREEMKCLTRDREEEKKQILAIIQQIGSVSRSAQPGAAILGSNHGESSGLTGLQEPKALPESTFSQISATLSKSAPMIKCGEDTEDSEVELSERNRKVEDVVNADGCVGKNGADSAKLNYGFDAEEENSFEELSVSTIESIGKRDN